MTISNLRQCGADVVRNSPFTDGCLNVTPSIGACAEAGPRNDSRKCGIERRINRASGPEHFREEGQRVVCDVSEERSNYGQLASAYTGPGEDVNLGEIQNVADGEAAVGPEPV